MTHPWATARNFAVSPKKPIELMHMIKKKQMVRDAGDKGRTAAEQFYSLAA
jgi:hypothetical protein